MGLQVTSQPVSGGPNAKGHLYEKETHRVLQAGTSGLWAASVTSQRDRVFRRVWLSWTFSSAHDGLSGQWLLGKSSMAVGSARGWRGRARVGGPSGALSPWVWA